MKLLILPPYEDSHGRIKSMFTRDFRSVLPGTQLQGIRFTTVINACPETAYEVGKKRALYLEWIDSMVKPRLAEEAPYIDISAYIAL